MMAAIKIVVPAETLKRAELLRSEGFVHVTGLRAYSSHSDSYIIQARRHHLGMCGYNNGKTVLVTEDGEVWLGAGYGAAPEGLCPNGDRAFVPCSNGEQIDTHSLLKRVADSYSDVSGNYSPVPKIES